MDIKAEIARAAAEWPLSLRDDPTAFGPSDTWLSVTDKANAAIRENARSAISRGLGKLVDDVAVACEVEIEENGGLADLDEVIARFAPGLEVETAPIYEASDWTARVAAIRQAFGLAVAGMPISTVDEKQLREFVGSELRLAHLHGAALPQKPKHDLEIPADLDRRKKDIYQDAADNMKAPGPLIEGNARVIGIAPELAAGYGDDFKPPAFIAKAFEQAAPAADDGDGWDDEPPAPATPAPAKAAKGDAPVSPIASIAAHLSELGVRDADLAEAIGISRPYLSLMRKGERTWSPATPERMAALRAIAEHKAKVAQDAISEAGAP
jgi:hypothetical protein